MIKKKILYSGIFICGVFSMFPAVASDTAVGACPDRLRADNSRLKVLLAKTLASKRTRSPAAAGDGTSKAAKIRRRTAASAAAEDTESDSSTSSGSLGTATSARDSKPARCELAHMEDTDLYAKATTDTAFKHLFSPNESENRELLISFLNTFVPAFRDDPVRTIEAMPVSVPVLPSAGQKQTFMDLYVRSCGDVQYIVEMQARRHAMFDERALYYASSVYARQISEQHFKDPTWYYHLKPVIALQVLDYDTNRIKGIKAQDSAIVTTAEKHLIEKVKEFPLKDDQFLKHFMLTDTTSGQHMDYLQLLQLELPRAARIKDLKLKDRATFDLQDWWLDILVNSTSYTPEKVEQWYSDKIMPEIIYKSLCRLDTKKWDPGMIKEYKGDLTHREHYETMLAVEKAEGIAEGRMKTILEAMLNARDDGVLDEVLSKLLKLNEKEKLLLALDTDSIKAKLKDLEGSVVTSEAGAAAVSTGS